MRGKKVLFLRFKFVISRGHTSGDKIRVYSKILYIYIFIHIHIHTYILDFGFFVFNGISTFVGYLMPKPFF